MSLGTQPLPAATVTELAAATAFAATGLPDVPVFMGPAGGTYPVNTPVLFGAGDITSLQALFPNGNAVKECALAVVDVAQPFVFMRMTTASVATLITAATVARNASSNFTSTLAGAALDGADVVITFGTVGGNTGTGPIAYTVSTNGGTTTGTVQALGVGTSITVLGVTVTLGSGKIVTAGDTISWSQWPPSSTVLPITTSGAGALGAYQGTSVITVTGTPLDAYNVAWQVTDDGNGGAGTTIGVTGIKFRYTLDFDSETPTWSQVQSLGTAATFALLDGPISSAPTGLTLNFAAGNLKTADQVAFRCSSPTYDSAGLTAACAALVAAYNAGTVMWTWVRAIGPVPEAVAAAADSIALAWEGSGPTTGCQPSWLIVDALDRASANLVSWSSYIKASYAPYTSTHVPVAAGMLHGYDPINGRNNRRSNAAFYMARAMGAGGATIATDWGEYDFGPLKASVTMVGSTGLAEEHDANQDPSLQAMGFVTARHWPGDVGVYPTKASLLGPANDIQRLPLRRVMNVAKKIERSALRLQCVKSFRQWTSQPGPLKAKSPYKAGDVYEVDARRIERIVNELLDLGVLDKGYVSGIQFVLDRTPTSNGGGSYTLNGAMQVESLIYVDIANGTAQFVGAVT